MIGEDWWILFEGHLWGRDAGKIVSHYAGYVSLVPQLIGWSTAWLPAAGQVHALAFAALLIAALSLGWLASPRFAALLPDPRGRAFVALLLVLFPLGDAPLLCATMYAHWHLLWVVCLMTVAATPRTPQGRAGELLLAALCAWSHPLAVLCVPLFLARAWWRGPGIERRHCLALALLPLIYLTIGLDGSGSATLRAGAWHGFVPLWTNSILPSLTLGPGRAAWWHAHDLPFALLAVPFIALGWVCLRLPDLRALRATSALLLAAALAISLATALSRWAGQQRLLVASPRYGYVPALLLLTWSSVVWLRAAGQRVRLAGALLLVHALALNTYAGRLRYAVRPESRGRVVAFATSVAAWARTPGPAGETRRLALPGRAIEVTRPAPRQTSAAPVR